MSSSSSDFLESSFDLESSAHFALHLDFHESTPETLGQEIISHSQLIGVSVLISGLFSNLLLLLNSIGLSLDGVRLIGNTFFK